MDDISSQRESKVILSSLMAQRVSHARALLVKAGLTRSGTKAEVEKRIFEALKDGQITIAQVIEVLDTIEAWGRQHVFLYNAPSKIPDHLLSASALRAHLSSIGWQVTLNSPANIGLPEVKTVRLIRLVRNRLRIEWVESRHWNERTPDSDYTEIKNGEEITYQANRKRIQRAISSFEWDFDAQTAELFIHRLPSGTQYAKESEAFRTLLKPVVDLDNFEPLRTRRALARLKDAPGVRERKTNYVATNGSKLSMQSADRATTLGAEADLKEVRELIRRSRKFGAAFLNCFWEENEELQEEIHTHIDSFDSRVGVLAQCSEESVRHVLSRIRQAAV